MKLAGKLYDQVITIAAVTHIISILFGSRGAFRYVLFASSGLLLIVCYLLGYSHGSKKHVKKLAEANKQIREITGSRGR